MMNNSIFDTSQIQIKEMSDDEFYDEATYKLEEILKHEFKGNPQKQKVKKTTNGLNFACPFCGDSATDDKKKRAHFIMRGKWAGSFKCFNCGKYMKINNFFKTFKTPLTLSALTYVVNHTTDVSTQLKHKNEITSDILDKESVEKYSIPRETLKQKFRLYEIDKVTAPIAYNYLVGRCQYDFNKFLYDPINAYIVILNLIGNDKVFGFQVRDLSFKRKEKYKTMSLSNLHKALQDGIDVPETVNSLSTVFNIFNIDVYRPVLVTEGPFDAFLLPNCIAMSGANKSIGVELPFWYVFDSDKTGNEQALKKLQAGYNVFMWEQFKKDIGLPDQNPYSKNKNKWDINDVMIWCRDNAYTQKIYWSKYFSNDMLDGLDI